MSAPHHPAPSRGRLALRLSGLAALGLLSLLLVPVERIAPLDGASPDGPAWGLRAAAMVQPALLATAAILLGARLAPRLGLGAPYLEGRLSPDLRAPETLRRLRADLVVGLAGRIVLVGYGAGFGALAGEEARRAAEAWAPPLLARMLHGGLVEEIVMRWGVMTGLAWLIWRLAGRPTPPPPRVFVAAMAGAALLFAAGTFRCS